MDIIKKAMLMGLGLISLTKEKAEIFADELIKRGELAKEEKSKMVDKMLEEAEKQKEEFTGKVKETFQKLITDIGLVTQKEIEEILKKQEELEKKLAEIEKKLS